MTDLQHGLVWIVLLGCIAYAIRWAILDWWVCEYEGCHLSARTMRRSALGLRSLAMYCRFHAKQVDRARRASQPRST